MRLSRSGVGQFVPAFFPVPQVPVVIPTGHAHGLGDFVHATFSTAPILPGNAGLGCACGGGCQSSRGMAGFTDDISAMIGGTASMETYLLYGGGALLILWLLMGRSKSNRQGYRSARKQALAKLREQYPTRGRAVVRAGRSAAAHF